MEKDFFDEELERKERENDVGEQRRRQVDDWYNYGPTNNGGSSQNVKHRPLYVALVCIALVLALIFGWVLCSIFSTESNSVGVLDEVISYLDTEYYKEITDQAMLDAIAAGGTAILQSAGDQYSRLMTPQQYYDYYYQTDSTVDTSDERGYFGFTYVNYVTGLYVSEVMADSSTYGILESGDLIVKITDVTTDKFGTPLRNENGETISQIVVADTDSDTLTEIMSQIYSANYHYLRGGQLLSTGKITRGGVGNFSTDYDYDFIEFYFVGPDNQVYTNISKEPQNKSKHSTFEVRKLSQLPANTGYVRIDQFMYNFVYDENGNIQTEFKDGKLTYSMVTACDEFLEVMNLFSSLGLERLVLDLKGNPGGLVSAVCDIAGMLITDEKLTDEQKNDVTNENGELCITSLIVRETSQNNKNEYYYCPSTYSNYFDASSDLCNIVVWTDGNSASASELLTGALTDYKTAIQMGSCTYGKGIAQECMPLYSYKGTVTTSTGEKTQSYWAIYYTFAAYYSPLGTNIHGKGYTPEAKYNNLNSYEDLWVATREYWGVAD